MSNDDVKGLCLVEVFGIIYLGQNELKPADQIGTIKVSDGYTVACPLYKVNKKEHAKIPSVCYGDELILDGPKWSFVGCESFYIEVDLFNGSFKDTINFEWDSRSDFLYHKKKLLSEDGTGELLVLYGLFASASQARICVRLLNPGGSIVDVYGVIYANTNRCEHPMFTTMLFSAMESNKRKVAPGRILSLFRPTVAVSLTSKLYIDIGMFIDGVKLEKELEFDPKLSGDDTISVLIPSAGVKKPKLQVTVTWSG